MEFHRINKNINGVDLEFSIVKHPLINLEDVRKDLFEEMSEHLNVDDIVIDIGANHGVNALIYASKLGLRGKVYSFEASPNIFKYLEENCRRNQNLNITPINRAITEKDGDYTFHYVDASINGGFASETDAGIGACGHSQPVEVKGVNLCGWINKNLSEEESNRIKFIKIDAEGYDLKIIKSIKDILFKCRPIVQFEFFTDTSEREALEFINTFNELNYAVFYKAEESCKLSSLNFLMHKHNIIKLYTNRVGFDCVAYPVEQVLQ